MKVNASGIKKFLALKIVSIPGVAVFALAGLLLGMCVYYGPLETYAPITQAYHRLVPNDYWRHLLFRAYPETMFAAWFAQCAAVVAIASNAAKRYRIFHTHELFWRPFAGLISTIPGASLMAGILYLWNKYGIGSRVHEAAKAFCHAGQSGHCLAHKAVMTLNSTHPGVIGQFNQTVVADGQKKLIVVGGSLLFGVFVMKPYFLNVQGWLAEHRIISADAKNKSRAHFGMKPVPYIRFYHWIVPGFALRIKNMVRDDVDLHMENHKPRNNRIYRTFLAITVAGILGGAYIMFFVSQHQAIHLIVVH